MSSTASTSGNLCIKMRDPDRLLKLDHMAAIGIRDYTDRIGICYDNEAMSSGLGGGQGNVGMEGFLYHVMDPESQEVQMNWRGFLSDETQQDSRTSYANSFKFIQMLQDSGRLPRNGKSVLYLRSDGCGRQYKCANSMYLVQLLSLFFGIRIDWMVTCPHHGKNLVDVIAGRDKYDLMNAFIRGMSSAQ